MKRRAFSPFEETFYLVFIPYILISALSSFLVFVPQKLAPLWALVTGWCLDFCTASAGTCFGQASSCTSASRTGTGTSQKGRGASGHGNRRLAKSQRIGKWGEGGKGRGEGGKGEEGSERGGGEGGKGEEGSERGGGEGGKGRGEGGKGEEGSERGGGEGGKGEEGSERGGGEGHSLRSFSSQLSRKMQRNFAYFHMIHILWFNRFCFFSEYLQYASKRWMNPKSQGKQQDGTQDWKYQRIANT